MIAIVDYGVGNLFSLQSSFKAVGREAVVTGDEKIIKNADHIVLPGVGAFGDAAGKLKKTGMGGLVCEQAAAGKPILGICLGMQLLFQKSYEYGEHDGLGLIPGKVIPMEGYLPDGFKIPHIGWNSLRFPEGPTHRLFGGINEGDFVYFVHSYFAADCEKSLIADTIYGKPLTAAVAKDNIMGTQFHPEKSGTVGLKILEAFCNVR